MASWRTGAWWRWRCEAVRWWRVQPPFAYGLLARAFANRHGHVETEAERRRLRRESGAVQKHDAGAGSRRSSVQGSLSPGSQASLTIGQLARRSLKRTRHAAALAAWADAIQAKEVLELGTCLGITTAYLAKNPNTSRVVTIESNADRMGVAMDAWDRLGVTAAIDPHVGTFDAVLPGLLAERERTHAGTWDLIFIDGHHEGEALLRYVKLLMPWLAPEGLLVCDDIHWSPDMEQAWDQIRNWPNWTMTLDVFEMAAATQRRGLTPQDLKVVMRGHPRPVL